VIFRETGRTIVTTTLSLETVDDGAATDCAEMVTTGFALEGKSDGAVKTAGAPLAVCEGVIVPHEVPAQETFHWTPEFVGSFCTTATRVAVAFVNIVAGGCWVMVTAIGADTWKLVTALKLWSAVANAVIVTVLPTMPKNWVGGGITKFTVPPEAEWKPAGVQSMPPQSAFQSTPRLAGSPATVADRVTEDPAGATGGGNWVTVMLVTVEVTVTVNAEALLWSVVESAVTAMVLWGGTAAGAQKVVAAPLSVCAGEKYPQFAVLPQVAIQSTPALAGSLFTVADTWAEVLTGSVVGGSCTSAMEMTGVCDG